MSIDTNAALVDILREHKLLQPDQLQEITKPVLARFNEPRALSKYLMQRGWLTVFQVNQLFLGKAEELVLGHYRILDRLGEGGVSKVFKAWDTRRRCVVAVKAIRAEMASNAEAMGRFRREIAVVGQVSHPGFVRSYDIDTVGDEQFYAMEYVEGTDLNKLVKLSGPLPVNKACDYIRQAALALQHAHEKGLVHRDIKPGNLLLTVGGQTIKILDLGLARLQSSGSGGPMANLTQEGMMIGTPDYLAPEQARDARAVDIRADIYSLGCTLFYLITGGEPFAGGTVMQKLLNHQKSAPNLQAISSQVAGLADVIQKMMAKRPEDRFQTPAEVASALSRFC